MPLGSLISAGANLIGGLLGKKSADDNRSQALQLAQQNMDLQEKFAQQGIRWRVADAKAAGLHPLYALGANTASFSPVSIGSTADTSMPTALAAMGQDIGRAVNATRTSGERQDAFTKMSQTLQLERMGLENEVLRSTIARNNVQANPAMPSAGDNFMLPGQGNSPLIKNKELEVTRTAPGATWSEPGSVPDVGYARTPTGLAPIPSSDVKDRIEDMGIQTWTWALRNNLLPSLGFGNPPPTDPGKGRTWVFNPVKQEWVSMRVPQWMGRWGKYFAY